MPVYAASQKAPNVPTGPAGGNTPWVDPWTLVLANNAGQAGKITHAALEASRGSMGLGGKI